MLKNAICGRLAPNVLDCTECNGAGRSNRYITKTLLVMKLTFVLLTGFFLNVSANGVSQTVSFSGKQVELKKIFSAIKDQTGYVVFWSTDLLKETTPVSLDVKDMPLKEVLTIILKDQPLEYKIVEKTILLSHKEKVTTDQREMDAGLAPPIDVKGKVMNENGEPLIDASVTLKGTSYGTKTDSKGNFKMEGVTAGDYTLEISFVGYSTRTMSLKVAENGVSNLTFSLTPSLVNLDQLTVTGTLSKRAIRAYPATIAVIKQEDLKNRNINNIANVLESIPGIIIQPGTESFNAGSTREPMVLIRGADPTAIGIKYLVDGVEIVSGGRYSILQALDPNNIEKIEVLKGPMASTLYGNGGAGGIISITTKKGIAGKRNINFKGMLTQYANDYADYNGYSQNYNLNISGGDGAVNYLLGAAYNLYPTPKLSDTSNGINDKTWTYNARIGAKMKNLTADLGLEYGNQTKGSGNTYTTDNKFRVSLGLDPFPSFPFDDSKARQRTLVSSLHLNHVITTNWYQDLNVGYNSTEYIQTGRTPDFYSGYYTNYRYQLSKLNLRYFMSYDHEWSSVLKSGVTAGFEYNNSEIQQLTLSTTTPIVDFITSSNPAIGGSAVVSFGPSISKGYFAEVVTGFKNNLFLTTGIRFDVNSSYGDNVGAYAQPRIGLSYVLEPGQFKIKPRIVWGVSSAAPDPTYKITYIFLTSPYGNNGNLGNPDIKPQRSQGYEFGADIFYGSNYSFNITYYDQQIKDMIQWSNTIDLTTNPVTYYAYYFNVAKAINRGLEVSAKAMFQPFTLNLSYTYTKSKWGDETGQATSANVYPGAPLSGVPTKAFFANLSCKIPSVFSWTKKGGRIGLDWRYNGSSFSYDDISYTLATQAWQNAPDPKPDYPDYTHYYVWQKGYSYFNLRADYSVADQAAIYIDVQNLLDKQGSVTGKMISRFPGRRINFGFNINF